MHTLASNNDKDPYELSVTSEPSVPPPLLCVKMFAPPECEKCLSNSPSCERNVCPQGTNTECFIYMALFNVTPPQTGKNEILMEAIFLNYQFFHQNESCYSKSRLIKIKILLDKLIKTNLGCAPYA